VPHGQAAGSRHAAADARLRHTPQRDAADFMTASLAIHGGAGGLTRSTLPLERDAAVRAGLRRSLEAGIRILEAGGDALAAVVAAVVVLEDCEVFNAGRGAVQREDGSVVLDASVMRGVDRGSGAVAAVRRIRNPVLAAREVLREGRHVLLAAEGAERFAERRGLELVDPSYFVVPRAATASASAATPVVLTPESVAGGTVGAVARDARGGVAAATSTGGMSGAAAARVGDSPIVGAGTWADDGTCAVSATGTGEFFVRSAFAYEVDAGIRLAGLELETSCARSLERVRRIGGRGGCIAVDRRGQLCAIFDTPAMPRGEWVSGEEPRIAIFMGEDDRASRLGR
jgi:beta-aspartyl-peptidase (threonine type)